MAGPTPMRCRTWVRELSLQEVDFLYIGPDSFVSINSETVTEEALGYGIPSFAGTEFGFERSTALLGLVSRYFLVGKLAGLQAERLLIDGGVSGGNARRLPFPVLPSAADAGCPSSGRISADKPDPAGRDRGVDLWGSGPEST